MGSCLTSEDHSLERAFRVAYATSLLFSRTYVVFALFLAPLALPALAQPIAAPSGIKLHVADITREKTGVRCALQVDNFSDRDVLIKQLRSPFLALLFLRPDGELLTSKVIRISSMKPVEKADFLVVKAGKTYSVEHFLRYASFDGGEHWVVWGDRAFDVKDDPIRVKAMLHGIDAKQTIPIGNKSVAVSRAFSGESILTHSLTDTFPVVP